MVFEAYQTGNNVEWLLETWISTVSTTLILKDIYKNLFNEHNWTTDKNYLITVEKLDTSLRVIKREIMKVTKKVDNVLTVVRSAWYCPLSYDATTQTNTAQAFDANDRVSMNVVAENDKDVKGELVRLNSEKLNISDYQSWTYVYWASSTWNDDYSITIPYWPAWYLVWPVFKFMADVVNTWPATLNINSLWAKPIKKLHDRDLDWWDIEAWQIVTVSYDWTNFQMDSQVATIPTVDIHWQTEKVWWSEDDEVLIWDSLISWNKKIRQDRLHIPWLMKSDFLCWETIARWKFMFPETAPLLAQVNALQNVWDVTANKRIETSQFWLNISWNQIKICLWKYWTPAWNFWLRVETDNAWNSSWTLVATDAFWSIASSGLVDYAPQTDAHWISMSVSSAWTVTRWRKITTTYKLTSLTVTKHASSTATRCLIKNAWWTTLYTASFVWNIATIVGDLDKNTVYRVEVDNNGSNFVPYLWTPSTVIWKNITRNGWSANGSDQSSFWNIVSITSTVNENPPEITITLNGNVSIPKQKVHVVFFSWTYWSEWVDANNYFKLWYTNINTTTRWGKKRNWSVRGSDFTYPIYISSTLLASILYSKADATYSYKIPNRPYMAVLDMIPWDKAVYKRKWVSKAIAWTDKAQYFYTNTPWDISTTPWTNILRVAEWINWDWIILIDWFDKQTIWADVASATTITPTGNIFRVSWTTAIATINLPYIWFEGSIEIIPTWIFTTTTAWNIWLATTAVVWKVLKLTYIASTWKRYPNY